MCDEMKKQNNHICPRQRVLKLARAVEYMQT
jgi:hypothetical protein